MVFLSHCLLNQNTRYLGGAVCLGVVRGAVEPFMADGVGIVQMVCPEQRVWGGVLKRRFLWLVDHPRIARASRFLLRLVWPYLRIRYRRLARRVARDVEDYVSSGMDVVAVVGVAGSPSCGVTTTMDPPTSLYALGDCPQRLSTEWMNREVVEAAERPGLGLFIEMLNDEIDHRGLAVPMAEFDLANTGDDAG